jgi:hypothetical protein
MPDTGADASAYGFADARSDFGTYGSADAFAYCRAYGRSDASANVRTSFLLRVALGRVLAMHPALRHGAEVQDAYDLWWDLRWRLPVERD